MTETTNWMQCTMVDAFTTGRTVRANTTGHIGKIIARTSAGDYVMSIEAPGDPEYPPWKMSSMSDRTVEAQSSIGGIGTIKLSDLTKRGSTNLGYWWYTKDHKCRYLEENEGKKKEVVMKTAIDGAAVAEKTVDEQKSYKEHGKSDITEAFSRVAARRLSTAAHGVVCKAIEKAVPDEHKETARAVMQHPIAQESSRLLTGWAMRVTPRITADPRVKKMSEEFCVQGTAGIMDYALDAIQKQLLPVVMGAIEMMPNDEEEDKTRIGEHQASLPSGSELEEHDMVDAAEEAKATAK